MLSDANQSPPLVDFDRYASDAALREAVAAYGAQAREPELREIGLRAGSAEAIAWGDDANAHPPVLRAFDARGNRIDEVDYHPSYHRLMAAATRFGLHASSWSEPGAGAQVARAAGFYLWSQVDAGHGCPISMTHAAFPLLQRATALGTEWPAALLARSYDPSLRPIAQKGSALVGMALTERQGGSDLRANQTRALPLGARGPGERYALDGHKWFCSAPMSDAFLVLAQAPDGLSCFFVPRVLEDGTRNPFPLQRLKDKLGNRSNASSEVEFEGTLGTLVGEEGRGIATIVEMVNLTRLDCTIGSAAGMRQAALHAIHHARHRSAFGAPLSEAPAMRAVLADLALEAEAAIHLALRLARALDGAAAGDIR
ncbi:MAG: acyl-CoA dehydrogenase family protein, partial [Vulcanimicrobiaceae bacterium]